MNGLTKRGGHRGKGGKNRCQSLLRTRRRRQREATGWRSMWSNANNLTQRRGQEISAIHSTMRNASRLRSINLHSGQFSVTCERRRSHHSCPETTGNGPLATGVWLDNGSGWPGVLAACHMAYNFVEFIWGP
ncbi:hypothetical protein ACLKA7_013893 [Drosophila subpalustris]